jgi:hypothetical protein
MRSRTFEVGENLLVVAASLLQGVAQDGEAGRVEFT